MSSFTLRVTDSASSTTESIQNVDVGVGLIGTLPDMTENVFYAHALLAGGGMPPYTWSIVAGSLPPGIVIDADSGVISGEPGYGSPAAIGSPNSFTFTVRVTDSSSPPSYVEKEVSISEGTPTDPYFSYVSALLHFDGVDGSTSITDVIGNTWTVGGNAQIDTAQAKFGGASLELDGNGDYVSTPSADRFRINGDFTVEAWIRPDVAGTRVICSKRGAQNEWMLFVEGLGRLSWIVWNSSNSAFQATGSTVVTPGQWYHVAGVRSGGNLLLFVDGILEATVTGPVIANQQNNVVYIGRDSTAAPTRDFDGHIDDLRITKGLARYTANFTPPTRAFPDSGP